MQASIIDGEIVTAYDLLTKRTTNMAITSILRYTPNRHTDKHPRYRLVGVCSRTSNPLSKFCSKIFAEKVAGQLNINISEANMDAEMPDIFS